MLLSCHPEPSALADVLVSDTAPFPNIMLEVFWVRCILDLLTQNRWCWRKSKWPPYSHKLLLGGQQVVPLSDEDASCHLTLVYSERMAAQYFTCLKATASFFSTYLQKTPLLHLFLILYLQSHVVKIYFGLFSLLW